MKLGKLPGMISSQIAACLWRPLYVILCIPMSAKTRLLEASYFLSFVSLHIYVLCTLTTHLCPIIIASRLLWAKKKKSDTESPGSLKDMSHSCFRGRTSRTNCGGCLLSAVLPLRTVCASLNVDKSEDDSRIDKSLSSCVQEIQICSEKWRCRTEPSDTSPTNSPSITPKWRFYVKESICRVYVTSTFNVEKFGRSILLQMRCTGIHKQQYTG